MKSEMRHGKSGTETKKKKRVERVQEKLIHAAARVGT